MDFMFFTGLSVELSKWIQRESTCPSSLKSFPPSFPTSLSHQSTDNLFSITVLLPFFCPGPAHRPPPDLHSSLPGPQASFCPLPIHPPTHSLLPGSRVICPKHNTDHLSQFPFRTGSGSLMPFSYGLILKALSALLVSRPTHRPLNLQSVPHPTPMPSISFCTASVHGPALCDCLSHCDGPDLLPTQLPTGVVWHGAGTEMLAEEQRTPSENVVAIYATAVVPHKVPLSLAFWKYHFE